MLGMLWEDRVQSWTPVPTPLMNRSFPTLEEDESL